MKKFEYHCYQYCHGSPDAEERTFGEYLDAMGAEGWELVSDAFREGVSFLVFKRETGDAW